MFSNLSSSSISLATVTPSLVIRGAPNDLSIMTLRPFGPSVTLTALARTSTPRSIFSRASEEKRTSLAAICFQSSETRQITLISRGFLGRGGLTLDDAHDIGLLHDEELLAVDLDLGAAPLAEQDPVAGLEVEGNELAAFVASAGANGDDFALLRLFLSSVRNNDAALRLFLAFDATDDDAVMQGTEFHECFLFRNRPLKGARTVRWHSLRLSANGGQIVPKRFAVKCAWRLFLRPNWRQERTRASTRWWAETQRRPLSELYENSAGLAWC